MSIKEIVTQYKVNAFRSWIDDEYQVVHVRVPGEVLDRLDRIAEFGHDTRSGLVRNLLDEGSWELGRLLASACQGDDEAKREALRDYLLNGTDMPDDIDLEIVKGEAA